MTTREDWRTLPELRVANPLPDHVEEWLQRRDYRAAALADATAADAAGMRLNHEHARRAHIAHLATDAAPGPPLLPRRRRRSLWRVAADLAALTLAVLAVIGAVALMRALLGGL